MTIYTSTEFSLYDSDLKATIKITPDGDGIDCVCVKCEDATIYGKMDFTISKEIAMALGNALVKAASAEIEEY